MLKSKARGRVAGRAAAAGVVSAGVLLGLTALTARADVKTVTYNCAPSSGAAVTHDFTVSLTSSATGTQYTAILTLTAGTAGLPAPTAIASGAAIELQPSVAATASPAGMTAGVSTPSPTSPVSTAVASGAAMPAALPVATFTITPQQGATSVVLTAKDFKINMVAPGTTGTGTPTLLYTCTPATTGANTAPAVATLSVTGASTSPSTSASPSTSTTPTPTASTPRPTRTVYETVFASSKPTATKKKKSAQVTYTPGGGAATGGGGDAGPDGRVFVLTGTALMLAAATGGLMIRARRRPVRH